jgi:hypothetical protein
MQAYQFEQYVSPSHRISVELPADAPVGSARIIVLFPDQVAPVETPEPQFANMAEFHKWLITQPPTGRTAAEIDQQIREERDSWE